jgi:2-polyprenyl-3-methyl-5-hydroxy-6-metoxy-1,4-benzoquinol methylase
MNLKIDFACPICGSVHLTEKYKDTLGNDMPAFDYNFSPATSRHYRIVACNKCSHHFATPRHKDLYVNYNSDQVDETYISLSRQRIATNNIVIKTLLHYRRKGKLLDIGCATGDFLSTASKHYEVEGLELSGWSSKIAKDRGFNIHRCLIREVPKKEYYDIITLWGVIEHFEYPKQEVANMHALLKKNGLVILWTGDISSITAKLMGERWHYFHGQHIQLFTKRSLRKLFSVSGLEEVAISTYPYVMTMKSLANTLTRYPLLYKAMEPFISSKLLVDKKITIKLPGEMLAVFKKI